VVQKICKPSNRAIAPRKSAKALDSISQ